MVVNSTNYLCTKVKSLGSQAKGKLNSIIQTLINLAEAYSSTPKLRKKYKTSVVRSYRHFPAAELESQENDFVSHGDLGTDLYATCGMVVNSANHLCIKMKKLGCQAERKLNSKIQTQINLTETYPITLKLTIYLQCNLRVLLIRIIKSAVATPGKKDFYDQVYHNKKGKLHKEIRRTNHKLIMSANTGMAAISCLQINLNHSKLAQDCVASKTQGMNNKLTEFIICVVGKNTLGNLSHVILIVVKTVPDLPYIPPKI